MLKSRLHIEVIDSPISWTKYFFFSLAELDLTTARVSDIKSEKYVLPLPGKLSTFEKEVVGHFNTIRDFTSIFVI